MITEANIPGYKILRELGRGGIATVYLAVQKSLNRQVALKIMTPLLAAEENFSDRFIREGHTIAQLSHRNIINIHDIGIVDEQHYIAMEYLSAGSLRQQMQPACSPGFALSVVRQMARALGYAHEKGFIHRDVKPENILFRTDGTAVLTDFGIVKTAESDTRLTRTGTIVGTPRYMSPEQANGADAGRQSDIYSLGVILFEMLAGRPPYEMSESIAILYAHVNKPIPQLPEGVAELQPLVDSMMAKTAEKRVPDCKTVTEIIGLIEKEVTYAVENSIELALPAPLRIDARDRILHITRQFRLEPEINPDQLPNISSTHIRLPLDPSRNGDSGLAREHGEENKLADSQVTVQGEETPSHTVAASHSRASHTNPKKRTPLRVLAWILGTAMVLTVIGFYLDNAWQITNENAGQKEVSNTSLVDEKTQERKAVSDRAWKQALSEAEADARAENRIQPTKQNPQSSISKRLQGSVSTTTADKLQSVKKSTNENKNTARNLLEAERQAAKKARLQAQKEVQSLTQARKEAEAEALRLSKARAAVEAELARIRAGESARQVEEDAQRLVEAEALRLGKARAAVEAELARIRTSESARQAEEESRRQAEMRRQQEAEEDTQRLAEARQRAEAEAKRLGDARSRAEAELLRLSASNNTQEALEMARREREKLAQQTILDETEKLATARKAVEDEARRLQLARTEAEEEIRRLERLDKERQQQLAEQNQVAAAISRNQQEQLEKEAYELKQKEEQYQANIDAESARLDEARRAIEETRSRLEELERQLEAEHREAGDQKQKAERELAQALEIKQAAEAAFQQQSTQRQANIIDQRKQAAEALAMAEAERNSIAAEEEAVRLRKVEEAAKLKQAAEKQAVDSKAKQEQERRTAIDLLIAKAQAEQQNENLLSKENNGAIQLYQQVLSLESGQQEALAALEKIAVDHQQQAKSLLDSGDAATALLKVDVGLRADPGNKNLLALRNTINKSVKKAKEFELAEEAYLRALEYSHAGATNSAQNRACEQFAVAAKFGHRAGRKRYAICLADGQGVSRDEKRALDIFRSQADDGDAEAQYFASLGYAFSSHVDPKQAHHYAKLAVDQEYPRAYHLLSWLLDTGRGVERDSGQAVRLGFKTLGSVFKEKINYKLHVESWEQNFENEYQKLEEENKKRITGQNKDK